MWGLGIGEQEWRPECGPPYYEVALESAVLKPFKERRTLSVAGRPIPDGVANQTHITGRNRGT